MKRTISIITLLVAVVATAAVAQELQKAERARMRKRAAGSLPTGSVGGSEIANDAVDSQHLAAGGIDLEHLNVSDISGAAGAVAKAGVATDVNYVGGVHYDVVTFTNVVETATDGSDEGESQEILTFPEGRILILGAAINCTVTNTLGFEANPNDVFLVSIGTAAAGDDATLTSTEADIIASTTLDTAGNTDASTSGKPT